MDFSHGPNALKIFYTPTSGTGFESGGDAEVGKQRDPLTKHVQKKIIDRGSIKLAIRDPSIIQAFP